MFMQGHSPMNHLRPSKKMVAFEVTLKEKKHIAEGTVAFIFEKPSGFRVRAGQHVRMTLIPMQRNGGPFSMGSTKPTERVGFPKPCTSLRAGLLEASTVRLRVDREI